MWRTSQGERTLLGAEADLFRELLGYVYYHIDVVSRDNEIPYEAGVSLFDRLQPSQQLALLADVGEAMLDDMQPPPELTALREATVAVLYVELLSCVTMEIEIQRQGGPISTYWRSLTINALSSDGEDDDLPQASSDDLSDWELSIECIADRILWDRDWEMEDLFVDDAPEQSAVLKEYMSIADDYFEHIAPDPDDRQIIQVRVRIERLTGG